MTLPTAFANNTSPTGVQLDNDLLAVAAMGITVGTVVGTNTLTFTPGANQPAVGAYVNNSRFDFVAVATSTGAVTLQVNALSPLPVYKPGGSQATTGDVVNGSYYEVVFLQALNTGVGGFQIASSLPSASVSPVDVGSVKGLLVTNNGSTPNTKINVTGASAVLATTAGSPVFVASPSVTIDLTTTGANGMDTGSRPTSGWVYCYLISTGSVTAGLATATSPTSGGPTMPGGYSYRTYVGAMFCDGSQNLMRTRQLGREATYVVTPATNTTNNPSIASGIATSTVALTSLAPLTAATVDVIVGVTSTNGITLFVGPSSNYTVGTGAVPFISYTSGGTGAITTTVVGRIVLEAYSVYYSSSASHGYANLKGWTDYYVNA